MKITKFWTLNCHTSAELHSWAVQQHSTWNQLQWGVWKYSDSKGSKTSKQKIPFYSCSEIQDGRDGWCAYEIVKAVPPSHSHSSHLIKREKAHTLQASLSYNMAVFPSCSLLPTVYSKNMPCFYICIWTHAILSKEGTTLLFKCKRNINISGKASLKKLIYTVMSLVGLKTSTK